MGKKRLKEDEIYHTLYGHLPDDQLGRVNHILGSKLENAKYMASIEAEIRRIKRIRKTTLRFTMWKVVRPSARPRANGNMGYIRMYVPGAQEAGTWFQHFSAEHQLPFIETPCILNMTIYEKTPQSFSIKQKVLAELGFLRPWKRTGDFDNYAKGISDAIQHGMLKDDCLVIESTQKLYYSIKPHVDIEITYLNRFPSVKG